MDGEYVEGLTGEEIINDVLDQVANRLRGDCNLREADSYTGGYDGWVEVHLNLRGLDTAVVKTKIVMGTDPGSTEDATPVVARVEIANEPALNVVRERSGQPVPSLGKDEEGKTVVKKRHYGKSYGGATGEALEKV